MTVNQKSKRRPLSVGAEDSVGEWGATVVSSLIPPVAFDIDANNGDTLPAPHEDRFFNFIPKTPSSAVYYFQNSSDITLSATLPLRPGTFDGQTLRLSSASTGSVTILADSPGFRDNSGGITVTPGADRVLIWDEDAKVWSADQISGGPGLDTTAIHVNVAGEINGIASKVTPALADVIVLEDSENSFVKAKATVGDITDAVHTYDPAVPANWDPVPTLIRPALDQLASIVGQLFIVEANGLGGNFSTIGAAYTAAKAALGTPSVTNQATILILAGTYTFPDIDEPFIHFKGFGDVQISTSDVDVSHDATGIVEIEGINFIKMSMLLGTVVSDLLLRDCTFTDGFENISGLDGMKLRAEHCDFIAVNDQGFQSSQDIFVEFYRCKIERTDLLGDSMEVRRAPTICRDTSFVGRVFLQTATAPGPSLFMGCNFFSDTTDAFEKDNTGSVVELQNCTVNAPATFGIRSDNSGTLKHGVVTWSGDGHAFNGNGVFEEDISAGSLTHSRKGFASTTTTASLGRAEVYACTSTAAARTLTLSDVTTALGSPDHVYHVTIKDESGAAGTNNITIDTESGTIDGASSIIINVNFGSFSLYSNGTDWFGR